MGEVGLQYRYDKASLSPLGAVTVAIMFFHRIVTRFMLTWGMGPGLERDGSLQQSAISKGGLIAKSIPNMWRNKFPRLEKGTLTA